MCRHVCAGSCSSLCPAMMRDHIGQMECHKLFSVIRPSIKGNSMKIMNNRDHTLSMGSNKWTFHLLFKFKIGNTGTFNML